ncbi:MAG: tetratricopeptide repeat protein, partial [Planctomycetota bacterium]
ALLELSESKRKPERRDARLVREARLFLERYPHSDRTGAVRFLLASALRRLGRDEEALPVLRRLVAEHPRNAGAVRAEFWEGEIRVARAELDEALRAFRNCFEAWRRRRDEPPAQALLRIGRILAWKGHAQAAQKEFDRAMKRWPDSEAVKRIEKVELPILDRLGKEAPKIRLELPDGEALDLGQQPGKTLVLVLWSPASDPGAKLAAELRALQRSVAGRDDVALYGVLCDGAADFLEEAKITFPHAVQQGGVNAPAAVAFRLARLPETVVIGRTGTIRAMGVRGKVLRSLLPQKPG